MRSPRVIRNQTFSTYGKLAWIFRKFCVRTKWMTPYYIIMTRFPILNYKKSSITKKYLAKVKKIWSEMPDDVNFVNKSIIPVPVKSFRYINVMVSVVQYETTARCYLTLPPENIRKPSGFLMFSGSINKQHRKKAVSVQMLHFKRKHWPYLWRTRILESLDINTLR